MRKKIVIYYSPLFQFLTQELFVNCLLKNIIIKIMLVLFSVKSGIVWNRISDEKDTKAKKKKSNCWPIIMET